MKTWKLVSGILSAILFVIVALQSCAAGIGDALENSGGTSGGAGMLTGILMLAGGIVSIATHSIISKGSSVAMVVLYGLAALIGFTMHGIYSDLIIWAMWCLVNAILALTAIRKTD